MTAIAKLVFGVSHDKARLTEYATVLAWAADEQVPAGTLAERIAGFAGGVKAIVAAAPPVAGPLIPTPWDRIPTGDAPAPGRCIQVDSLGKDRSPLACSRAVERRSLRRCGRNWSPGAAPCRLTLTCRGKQAVSFAVRST